MSLDLTADKALIEAKLKELVGSRVYRDVPEEAILERYPESQLVKPYIILTFGQIFPIYRDRSMDSEAAQPHMMPIIVECWAADRHSAETTAGAVRVDLIGFETSDNLSEISAYGGGGWPSRPSTAGRPSRALETVALSAGVNMSVEVP